MYSSGKSAGAGRTQAAAVRAAKLAPTIAISQVLGVPFTASFVGSAAALLEQKKRARSPAPSSTTRTGLRVYGQSPVRMPAAGPFLKNVLVPPVAAGLWTQ